MQVPFWELTPEQQLEQKRQTLQRLGSNWQLDPDENIRMKSEAFAPIKAQYEAILNGSASVAESNDPLIQSGLSKTRKLDQAQPRLAGGFF